MVAVYVAAITAIGTWLGRRQRTLDGYFLAGRSVPWWALASCIVATETSTLTFVGVPGSAYTGNWTFLQLALGLVLGRVVVAAVLLPSYFRGRLFTSYGFLNDRFGTGVRTAAAGVFLVSRTLGDGIRLHAAALVIAVVLGAPHWEPAFVLLLGGAMIVYTEEGGVVATIWTDAVQPIVYLLGAALCFASVLSQLPVGLGAALEKAAAAGKLTVLNTSGDFSQTYTLWAGLVGGIFLTLATHGTDQYLVQRLLVARSRRHASLGLIVSGFVVFAQFAFFLLLGTLLWVHYDGRAFARGDDVLPTFVASSLPGAWSGLILAAVIAAAFSPSLNAMAGTTLKDFYVPLVRPDADEAHQVRMGRMLTVFWGVLQIGVAILAQDVKSALDLGLAVLSYASGPTVGAFLLGVLTTRVRAAGALVGMALGLVASVAAARYGAAWTWNVAIGASTTVIAGYVTRLFPATR